MLEILIDNNSFDLNSTRLLTSNSLLSSPTSSTSSTQSVFRFKFTSDFSTELSRFSKNHQYDDRKIFKEEFNKWVVDNKNLVEDEIEYLQRNGYNGDIQSKIFISSRFYYRKKEGKITNNCEKESESNEKPKQQKKEYVLLNKELIHKIDNYIIGLNTEEGKVILKPEEGFESFCRDCSELLKNLIRFYLENDNTQNQKPEDMKKKIKKLFKNRYYYIYNLANK